MTDERVITACVVTSGEKRLSQEIFVGKKMNSSITRIQVSLFVQKDIWHQRKLRQEEQQEDIVLRKPTILILSIVKSALQKRREL